jgi:methionyl aminopeptidase
MAIDIKSPKELEMMREAGRMAAETLVLVGERLRAGMTTEEINTFVHEDTLRRNALPAPLNYRGFPKSVCTSINEVVCHGIPGKRPLRDGDIINVDITTKYNGFHGDTSATFYIGTPSADARKVVECSRKALEIGISVVKEGTRLNEIGRAIQEYVEAQGCSVVRDFVGHGIGRRFHEEPQVKHYFSNSMEDRIRLKPGMIFTIEPMVNLGGWEVVIDPHDKWTVTTVDGSLSAQFEHTILVTKTGAEVLTARQRPLRLSEDVAPQTVYRSSESAR